jgi:hypothetical protein
MTKGWHGEPVRHRKAALGIHTGHHINRKIYKSFSGSKKKLEPTIKKGRNTGAYYYGTAEFTNEKGKKIPVLIVVTDKNVIPEELFVDRFMDPSISKAEREKDLKERARIVINPDPNLQMLEIEEIAEWWNDPTKMDVQGVDTPGSSGKYLDIKEYDFDSKEMYEAQKGIAVMGGSVTDRIYLRNSLAENFTVDEIKKLKGTVYMITDLSGSVSGRYCLLKEGEGSANLVQIDKNYGTPETVVHETVHSLRFIEKRKRKDPSLRRPSSACIGKDMDLEEAGATAETVARTNPVSLKDDPSYYQYIDRDRPDIPKGVDRALFTGKKFNPDYITPFEAKVANPDLVSSGLKGEAAVESVRKNFPKSRISHLKLTKRKGEAIDRYFQIQQKVKHRGKTKEIPMSIHEYSPSGKEDKPPEPSKGREVFEYKDGKKVEVK